MIKVYSKSKNKPNFVLQSLQHEQNLVLSKDRFELLENSTERMVQDGIMQAKYDLISKVETELYIKLNVDLLFEKEVDHQVSMHQ